MPHYPRSYSYPSDKIPHLDRFYIVPKPQYMKDRWIHHLFCGMTHNRFLQKWTLLQRPDRSIPDGRSSFLPDPGSRYSRTLSSVCFEIVEHTSDLLYAMPSSREDSAFASFLYRSETAIYEGPMDSSSVLWHDAQSFPAKMDSTPTAGSINS